MTKQKQMNAQELIEYISTSEKKTPVKVTLRAAGEIQAPNCRVFDMGAGKIIFGDWKDVEPLLAGYAEEDYVVENNCRNSAIPMVDMKQYNARIEPGAIIRDPVTIDDNAVVMMGAIINMGAEIGSGTMIDMGAILGARATVGRNCHIGAGTVLAGVIEPQSADPVRIEDDVVIGANAVVLEGVHIGKGSIVAAGAVVVDNVPPNVVVGGVPARTLKQKDDKSVNKTELIEALRRL